MPYNWRHEQVIIWFTRAYIRDRTALRRASKVEPRKNPAYCQLNPTTQRYARWLADHDAPDLNLIETCGGILKVHPGILTPPRAGWRPNRKAKL